MSDQIEISLPKTRIKERTGFTATAYFRTRSTKAATAPTTARYRIDDLSSKSQILDWTTLTVGTSIAIAITATQNKIIADSRSSERKQLTVQADYGTSTQVTQSTEWTVTNLYGMT